MGQAKPLHLGLTGGIGSGKSTLAHIWAAMGMAVVDADVIARTLTAPGGDAIARIANQFGQGFISVDGAMNRAAMRKYVLSNPIAKQHLEAILHPLIQQNSAEQARLAAAQGHTVVVFDIPLLVESKHWAQRLDLVVVVDCDVPTQIERVIARSGWPIETTQSVLKAQASRGERLSKADIVVMNGSACTLPQLECQAKQIAGWFGL